MNPQPPDNKPSALTIELSRSKASTAKESNLSRWNITPGILHHHAKLFSELLGSTYQMLI